MGKAWEEEREDEGKGPGRGGGGLGVCVCRGVIAGSGPEMADEFTAGGGWCEVGAAADE